MNTLEQLPSFLLGSEQAVQKLATKEKAKLLIFSDSHGSSLLVQKILSSFACDCDGLVFCGDGICDLVSAVEALLISSQKELLPPVMAFVRGNGDYDTYTMNEKKIFVPESQVFEVAHHTLLAVHGHRNGVDFGISQLADKANAYHANIAFYGHTHRSASETYGSVYTLNPGSCSRPRGGTLPSIAIVEISNPTTGSGVSEYKTEYFKINHSAFSGISFTPIKHLNNSNW